MASHPTNLAVRFLLEITVLVAMGVWSWRTAEGWSRIVLVVLVPIVAAVLWSTFAVPNDPSRSGTAPVALPGTFRLAIEIGMFVFAAWALSDVGFSRASWVLGGIVAVHYMLSYDRILWLVMKN